VGWRLARSSEHGGTHKGSRDAARARLPEEPPARLQAFFGLAAALARHGHGRRDPGYSIELQTDAMQACHRQMPRGGRRGAGAGLSDRILAIDMVRAIALFGSSSNSCICVTCDWQSEAPHPGVRSFL
jgi:hypothetical protein